MAKTVKQFMPGSVRENGTRKNGRVKYEFLPLTEQQIAQHNPKIHRMLKRKNYENCMHLYYAAKITRNEKRIARIQKQNNTLEILRKAYASNNAEVIANAKMLVRAYRFKAMLARLEANGIKIAE